MGGFEDIFNDLFGQNQRGGRRNRAPQEKEYDDSPISMNLVLNFEESVKGATKVQQTSFRLSSSIASANAQSAKVRKANLELSLKSADLAMDQVLRPSGRECLS